MAEPLLEIAGLSVRHGAARAVNGVSMAVMAGEVVALLGANGAGKSSLISAVIGLAPMSRGEIRFAGEVLTGLPPQRRARLGIGYVPEGRRVFAGMSAEDNLFVACRAGPHRRQERAAAMYELFPQLGERRRAPAWQLSGGEQQMLAIARALMDEPRLLLVDEPTLGLAPALVDAVTTALRGIAASGTGVLLAEQNAGPALAACDRALVMRLGAVESEGTPQSLTGDARLMSLLMGG